jgi:ketosteroid isomerase-like protein
MSDKIKLVLSILQDEVNGDTKSAISKVAKGYTMTWVEKRGENLFPRETTATEDDLEEIYKIKGRKYEIMNISESDNAVMVEMIESYPDQKTSKAYRTPLVIVLEFENGKIKTGRHYVDSDLSSLYLTKKDTDRAFIKTEPIIVIE